MKCSPHDFDPNGRSCQWLSACQSWLACGHPSLRERCANGVHQERSATWSVSISYFLQSGVQCVHQLRMSLHYGVECMVCTNDWTARSASVVFSEQRRVRSDSIIFPNGVQGVRPSSFEQRRVRGGSSTHISEESSVR